MQNEKADFIASRKIAVVGVSRTRGFGNTAFRALKARGYTVYPVNSQADTVEGEKCYRGLADLPEAVDGVVVVVPPGRSAGVVADAVRLGIKRVWLQQGAESDEAVKLCQDNGVSCITGACIMMHASPTGFHGFHRWLWRLLGKL